MQSDRRKRNGKSVSESVEFGNFSSAPQSVVLGTVTISVASVPEPNSLVIVFCALLSVAAYVRLGRRR
jgi:hypothetical protein